MICIGQVVCALWCWLKYMLVSYDNTIAYKIGDINSASFSSCSYSKCNSFICSKIVSASALDACFNFSSSFCALRERNVCCKNVWIFYSYFCFDDCYSSSFLFYLCEVGSLCVSVLYSFGLSVFSLCSTLLPHCSCSLTTSPPLHPCLPSFPPAFSYSDRCTHTRAHTGSHSRPGFNYLQTLLWHTTFATSPPDCTQMLSQPN